MLFHHDMEEVHSGTFSEPQSYPYSDQPSCHYEQPALRMEEPTAFTSEIPYSDYPSSMPPASYCDEEQLSYLDALNLAQAPAKVGRLLEQPDRVRLHRLEKEIHLFCMMTVRALDATFGKEEIRELVLHQSLKRNTPSALYDTDLLWKVNHKLKKKVVSKQEMLDTILEVLVALA